MPEAVQLGIQHLAQAAHIQPMAIEIHVKEQFRWYRQRLLQHWLWRELWMSMSTATRPMRWVLIPTPAPHMLRWDKCQKVKKEECHHSMLEEAGLVHTNWCTVDSAGSGTEIFNSRFGNMERRAPDAISEPCSLVQDLEKYNSKLNDLEQRVHVAISKGGNSDELHKLETRLENVHSSGGGEGQLRELEQQVRKVTH